MLSRIRGRLPPDLHRVFGNALWKAISVPVEKVCRILIMIVAARTLGETTFGTYQFATTLTALFALCADLGLSLWTTRALARDASRTRAIVSTGLRLRAASSVPYLLALVVALSVSGPGEVRRAILLFGAAALANTFVDYLGAIFRGLERLRDEARLNIARALLIAGAGLAALWAGHTLSALAGGVLIGTLASVAFGFAILHRRQGSFALAGSGAFDATLARSALREAAPMWVATLLSLLYFKIDVLILRSFAGDAELGAYSAAFKVFDALTILPSIIMAAAFAPLARAHANPALRRRWEAGLMALLFAFGCVVGGAVYAGSDRIITGLFGVRFMRALPSLRILSLGVPILFVNSALRQFLFARSLEYRNLLLSGLLLLINVAINAILIPRLGGPGAAWATLVTEGMLTLFCLLAIGWRPARRGGA